MSTNDRELLQRVDAVCEAFEESWRRGGARPALDEHVSSFERSGQTVLLSHLVPIDLHYRRRAGEIPDLAEYARRFPSLDTHAFLAQSGQRTRIGDFVIERKLGQGGMGVVYAARQLSLDRPVALKVLPAAAQLDDGAVERFQQEARAAGRLHHTNIVPVFEAGRLEQSSRYIAMQLIQGASLDRLHHDETAEDALTPLRRQWEDDRPRYVRRIVTLGIAVADALQFAHERGVLHRDMKPSNLILDEDGVVWVADFGLAKIAGQDLTEAGGLLGTLRYMAPERLEGQGDARADVYALGVTLYELLSARPLFDERDRAALMKAITDRAPAALGSGSAALPRDLEVVIERTLAKEPRDRYPSAAALAEDLRRILDDRPILARRATPFERARRFARRNPALAAASLAATLLGVLFAIAALLFAAESRANARLAASERDARVRADSASREMRRTLYGAQMRLAADAINSEGGIRAIAECVTPWATPRPEGRDVRGWEWYFARRIVEQAALDVPLEEMPLSVAWHPQDGVLVVAGHGIHVFDAETGSHLARVPKPGGLLFEVRFSPDGRRLAVASDNGLHLLATESWTVTRHVPTEKWCSRVAWRADSRTLAYQCFDDPVLRVIDVESGEPVDTPAVMDGLDGQSPRMQPDPTGRRVCTAITGHDVVVLDTETGRRERSLGLHELVFATAISEHGTIAIGGLDRTVRLFDPEGRPRGSLTGHQERVTSLRWHRAKLASSSWDHSVRVWSESAQRAVRILRGHTDYVSDLAWSPAGDRLATVGRDRKLLVWSLDTGPPRAEFFVGDPHVGDLYDITWDQLGRVNACFDGQHVAWDGGRNERPKLTPGHTAASRDGSVEARFVAGHLAVSREGVPVIDRMPWNGGADFSIVASPRGRSVALGNEAGVTLVSLAAPDSRLVPLGTVWDLTFDAEGEMLAVAQDFVVVLLDSTGDEMRRLTFPESVGRISAVAFDHTGERLAVGAADQTVRIVDVRSGRILHAMTGHGRGVRDVCWSPDSSRVVSAADDGTVKLWDPEIGVLVFDLTVSGRAMAVCFSPDGGSLACATSEGFLTVWSGEAPASPPARDTR